MSSETLPISRKGARILLAMCMLAMAWYGAYQVGHLVRLLTAQFSMPIG